MSMDEEEWRDIPGHEGRYQVSDRGRVKSLDRIIERPIGKGRTPTATTRIFAPGMMLAPGRAGHGYQTVVICKGKNSRSYCVHVLVLMAFSGPRPVKGVSRHLDGNKDNNRASNLVWGTYKENSADAARHGTTIRGSAFKTAKLSDREVSEIRALRGALPQSVLARAFLVSPSAIQGVIDGRTWKHAPVMPFDEAHALRASARSFQANARHWLKQRGALR
jgi:hypothetical protein